MVRYGESGHSGVHFLHSYLALLEVNELSSRVRAIFSERLTLK